MIDAGGCCASITGENAREAPASRCSWQSRKGLLSQHRDWRLAEAAKWDSSRTHLPIRRAAGPFNTLVELSIE